MRPGPTQMDMDEKCVGSIDEPLCELGRKKSAEAAVNFAVNCESRGEKINLIVSSPMKRAYATARIFSEHLEAPLTLDGLLRERHLGKIQGKPGNPYDNIFFPRNGYLPIGSTPLKEFEEQTAVFLEGLADRRFAPYPNVLFVTHYCRLIAIIKLIKGWNERSIMKYSSPANCEIKTFGIGPPCKKCGSQFYEPLV